MTENVFYNIITRWEFYDFSNFNRVKSIVNGRYVKMKAESKKALTIGIVCIATYLANYYLRNILSVLTPQLLETKLFTVEHIGVLSSTYMFFYAAGQLVNGFLGDIFSPKRMVVVGIWIAGLSFILFPFIDSSTVQIISFAIFGFGLSMVRGPLMKIISENTTPYHARNICVFFSFASFAGPMVATLFAMQGNWRFVFIAASVVAMTCALAAYVVLSVLEKKKQLAYKTSKGQGISSLLSVFKIEKFPFYMIVACLVEISAASISFWIPTFLTENLGFVKNSANILFTIISLIRALMPFLALAIFRAINKRDIAMMRSTFIISSLMFIGLILTPNKWLSLIFLILALMAMSCCSALLWSIYIPGLGKTGKVSSVNGVLDCSGYIAAAITNIIFANVMSNVGWNAVICIWASIGVIGFTATLFVKKSKNAEVQN